MSAGGIKVEASLLSQFSSQHDPFKKKDVLPVPISDFSLAAHPNKAVVEEIQNISTTSSLRVILLYTVPPCTKQILTSVRLVSDPSQDTYLTSYTILCPFFLLLLFEIDLTKWLLFLRSSQAFFISSTKNLLLETWLQSQPD